MLVLRRPLHLIVQTLFAGSLLLTACSKADTEEGAKQDEDCRIVVVGDRVVDENQSIVELTVENDSDQPLAVSVRANYLSDGAVIGQGDGFYSEVAGGQRARFRIRPVTPLGPDGFDCVNYAATTQRVGARAIRRCVDFESCR